jgi:hypothetical protein
MQYRLKKIDYTVPSGFDGGPGVGKQWTPYVGSPYINMTTAQFAAVSQNIGAKLGDCWTLGGQAAALGGNSFMFVRAAEALTLGQLVGSRPPTTTVDDAAGAASTVITGAGSAASPTTTTAICTTNIDNTSFTVPIGVNEDVDNFIFVNSAAATTPQLRRIKANSSSSTSFYTVALPDRMRPNSATDADVFDSVPLNTELVSIIRPYHVVVNNSSTFAGGVTTTPIGVALGTVTAGNYTIIQLTGLANVLIDADGVNEGIVQDQPAWGTAADGAIKGANGVASIYTAASLILPKFAATDDIAAGILVPCFVNFRAQ